MSLMIYKNDTRILIPSLCAYIYVCVALFKRRTYTSNYSAIKVKVKVTVMVNNGEVVTLLLHELLKLYNLQLTIVAICPTLLGRATHCHES